MEKQIQKGRFLKNFVSFFASRGLDIFFALLSTMIIARYLGVQEFGVYVYATSVVLFIIPITFFGLERVTIREIAKSRENAGSAIGAALSARWILMGLATAIIMAVALVMRDDQRLVALILLTALSELVNSASSVYISAFRAFEKMEYETVITLVTRALSLAGVIAAWKLGLGIAAIICAFLAANIIKLAVSMYLSERRFVRADVHGGRGRVRELLKESYLIGIGVFFMMSMPRLSILMLKHFGAQEGLSYFQAAFAVYQQILVFPLSISMAIFPALSRKAGGDSPNQPGLIQPVKEALIFIVFPLSVMLYMLSGDLIRLMYGAPFFNAGGVLRIFSVALLLEFMFVAYEFFFIAYSKNRMISTGRGIAFFINLTLSFLLIPRYGYEGAAWILVISNLALFIYYAVGFAQLQKGLWNRRFIAYILKVVAASSASCLFMIYFKGESIPVNLALAVAGFIIYLAIVAMLKGIPSFLLKRPRPADRRV